MKSGVEWLLVTTLQRETESAVRAKADKGQANAALADR
jgi:hypothetical protein